TNNWTHIVQTWSNQKMCIFLETSGFGTNCQTLNIIMGSYSGRIDEFYVYDRELTENEICPLAHPYN
ncbi:unnamed protein product, partial [Rotaria sordida]